MLASSIERTVQELFFFLFSRQGALVLFSKCTTIPQELIPDHWKVSCNPVTRCHGHVSLLGNWKGLYNDVHRLRNLSKQTQMCQGVLTQLCHQTYPHLLF